MNNKIIVFTNGCFDILHLGHIEYLAEAKSLGNYLIVGINSDASVRALKGEGRPINNQEYRQKMLLALKSVDQVEIFNEPTPINLIKKINPNFLVKGGDWPIETIVGHEFVIANGGTVKSLIFKEGFSTTNLISKLQGKK